MREWINLVENVNQIDEGYDEPKLEQWVTIWVEPDGRVHTYHDVHHADALLMIPDAPDENEAFEDGWVRAGVIVWQNSIADPQTYIECSEARPSIMRRAIQTMEKEFRKIAGYRMERFMLNDKWVTPAQFEQIISESLVGESLNETFVDGFAGLGGKPCEIFKNPTPKELKGCMDPSSHSVRAFLVGDDILIWNTFAALHGMVRTALSVPKEGIPLVIYMEPRGLGGECNVEVTDASTSTPWYHNPEIVEEIHTHPYMRGFKDVEISFFDEAIFGDWRDLDGNEAQ